VCIVKKKVEKLRSVGNRTAKKAGKGACCKSKAAVAKVDAKWEFCNKAANREIFL
jgi:DNA transposition AAA+ family ATPase